MPTKMLNKAVIGASFVAAAAAMPGLVQADSYGYSTIQLPFFTFEAEYTSSTGGTEWARPASFNIPGSGARLTDSTFANVGAPFSHSENFLDDVQFDTHIPPPGTFGPGFPVDASQAFVSVQAATQPPQNDFAPTTPNGQFVRADGIWSQLGAAISPFGNFQSAGEASALVAEGFLKSSLAAKSVNSIAENTFRGQIDLHDLSLSSDADLPPPPVPTAWTGLVRIRFDYDSVLDMYTTQMDEAVTARYSFDLTLTQVASNGDAVTGGEVFTLTDTAVRTGFSSTDLNRTFGVQSGQVFNDVNSGTGMAIWDIASLASTTSINLWQIDIGTSASIISLTTPARPVPVPASAALLGLGLVGLGALRRRRKAAMLTA